MSVHATGQFAGDNGIKLYATKIINVLGGPGCNKGLAVSGIMFHLKLLGKKVEHIPSMGRTYMWLNRQDKLRNQYDIAEEQYRLFKALDGKVEYIVTEGSLVQCDYYNVTEKNNIADRVKVSEKILEWNKSFDNIYLWLHRNDVIEAGHNVSESKVSDVDKTMRQFYDTKCQLTLYDINQNPKTIHDCVKHILKGKE